MTDANDKLVFAVEGDTDTNYIVYMVSNNGRINVATRSAYRHPLPVVLVNLLMLAVNSAALAQAI
jgi:hypothetical protein